MINYLLMLNGYELIGQCCIDFSKFNADCSKVCQVAPKISEIGPKFSQVGPKLVIDES
jgi:hypothetical protein